MRIVLALCLCVGIASNSRADGCSEVIRLLLKNANTVILGEVIDNNAGGVSSGSHVSLGCRIRVIDVLKGTPPPTDTIKAEIEVLRDHPFVPPKAGDKRVFFLLPPHNYAPTVFMTGDSCFCVQPASMASYVKRVADEMKIADRK